MPISNLKSQISNLKPQTCAIIVAGGSGTRMGSALPKQFLLLNGKPVIMHSIAAFFYSETQPQIILVLHPDYHGFWKELCIQHQFNIPHTLIDGGATRFHSVKNAIDQITDNDVLIAVHDAVRPLVSEAIINEAYRYAAVHGSVVASVKSRDSVRQIKDGRSVSLNREEIYLIQTPQTFKAALLKQAYEQPYDLCFTDDASVAERAGNFVTLIEGSYSNIKITFPDDMAIAETLINKKSHQL